jgi:hypothetical protein
MDVERDPPAPQDLSSLARETAPPPDLEDRTIRALRQQGFLAASAGRRALIMRLAAAIVLFLGGVTLGRVTASAMPQMEDHRPRFLLLLHGGPTGLPPDEESAVAREYGAWARQLRSEGRFVTGERLGDASVTVPQGDLPDAANVRGYFLISAASLDEAVAVARDCPHARRGGSVTVRPIDPT